MKAVNGKILVRVNNSQKEYMDIAGVEVKTVHKYGTNYRERSPVIGVFAETTEHFREGQAAIFHHNHFYLPSPYHLKGDMFSVPVNKTIFGTLDTHGDMTPVMGNIIVGLIPIPTLLPLPPDQQKTYINQYRVINPGWTKYKEGQTIFTRPHSGYEVIYTWEGTEKRIIKVDSDMVCGVVV